MRRYALSIASFLAGLAPGILHAQDDSGRIDESDVRGVIKAKSEAVLTVDLAASVAETPLRTGQSFQRDDILIRFDCEAHQAEADAAAASHAAAKARYSSNIELSKHDAIGEFDVAMSRAEMNEAGAKARAMRARLKDCEVRAPYDGKVAELAISVYETPRHDQPIMKIVGSGVLELRLIVPSKWLVWLAPGAPFTFAVDETGDELAAKVVRIGAEVDAVSRTVAIIAEFENTSDAVLPGMSGTARFKLPTG